MAACNRNQLLRFHRFGFAFLLLFSLLRREASTGLKVVIKDPDPLCLPGQHFNMQSSWVGVGFSTPRCRIIDFPGRKGKSKRRLPDTQQLFLLKRKSTFHWQDVTVSPLATRSLDFPGPVVRNPPASAWDTGSIHSPGKFHMLRGN